MSEKITRRKMLRKSASAALAASVGACAAPVCAVPIRPPTPRFAKGVDYYEKLGVTPFINAAGTYTVFTASTMPDEVQAAIAIASQKPVNISTSSRMPPDDIWPSG